MSSRAGRVAVVHDGYIPAYRVRLYELLAERGAFEYVVFHGPPSQRHASVAATGPFAFPNVEVRNRELKLGRGSLVHQTLVTRIVRGGFDAVVLGAFLRFVSSLVLVPAFKLSGRPVVFWGQGLDKQEDVAPISMMALRAKARLRSQVARVGDGYLVYTPGGREHLIAAGVDPERVFVVRNTLDMDEQIALQRRFAGADTAALRSPLGLRQDSVVLLYVGRLYREKRVGELLEAVEMLVSTERAVEVVVIGDGPELAGLRALAGGREHVHFRGAVRDQEVIARHMRVAAAVVIPGAVGLAVNHAFGQGVPVITRDSKLHGPEIEYLEHGRNGLLVRGDLQRFVGALARFVESPAEQRRLAEGALESRRLLDVGAMAEAFDLGVQAAVARSAGPFRPRSSTPAREPRAS